MKRTVSIWPPLQFCVMVAAMLAVRSTVASPPDEAWRIIPISNPRSVYVEDEYAPTREDRDGEFYVNAPTPAPIVEAGQAGSPDAAKDAEAAKKAAAEKKKKEELKKKIATAYKDPFYQNDFSYLSNPAYMGYNLGEGIKQLKVGDNGKLDVGGQYRLRYHHEQNMRGLGLTGRDDDFLLDRTRIYADYKINKRARVFAEFLDAGSSYENFAPRQIEVQRFDAQNLFGDLVLIDSDLGKLTGRAGRSLFR